MEKTQYEIPIAELLSQASVPDDLCTHYANHARLTLMNTELFIDFILVSPELPGFKPAAAHVQRVIYPVANARALINALVSVVSNWEKGPQTEATP